MGGWILAALIVICTASPVDTVFAEDFGREVNEFGHRLFEWNSGLTPGADFRWLFREVGRAPEPEARTRFPLLAAPLTAIMKSTVAEAPRQQSRETALVYEPEDVFHVPSGREMGPRDQSESGNVSTTPSPYFLTDDVLYFPAAPERKVIRSISEAPATPSHAARPTAAATTPSAAPLSKQRRQRRAKWSDALQAPAALVIDPSETVTLGDLLERIRQQHGLPVRVDLPHVLPITAMTQMVATKFSSPSSRTVSVPVNLPYPVIHTDGPAPLSPPALPMVMPPSGVPQYAPVAPAGVPLPVAPANTNTAYKLIAADEDQPAVSAIRAEVITKEPSAPEDKSPPVSSDDGELSEKISASQAVQKMLAEMLTAPVDIAVITQADATVEDVLRQAFDRSFPLQALINTSISEEFPMLASLSRATEWDLLVQDDGVLLTTRLNANLRKETRVYSVKSLEASAGLKAEDVARVLTRTVRPWSWKKNFSDAVMAKSAEAPKEKGKTETKTGKTYTLPKVNVDLSSVMGLISAAKTTADHQLRLVNSEVSPSADGTAAATDQVELTEEHLELLGRAWDGLFQGTVSSIQMIYHADPPTGVIEVLPGMLIISQSQSAHREISDLLEQLSHPEN